MAQRVLLILLLVFVGACGVASLPTAESLLARNIEITGGKEAYDKLQSLVIRTSIEYPTSGERGSQAIYLTKGDLAYTITEVPGRYTEEHGVKGNVAWERSSYGPPRIMSNVERAQVLSSNIDAISRWNDYYERAETIGEEVVEGQACYRVVMTPVLGNPRTIFLSKQTGLAVKMSMTVALQHKSMSLESVVNRYQTFGGFLLPARMTHKSGGLDFIATIDSVEVNSIIPPDRFDLPADVLALANEPAQ